jgi:hypothetical protein
MSDEFLEGLGGAVVFMLCLVGFVVVIEAMVYGWRKRT